MAFSPGSTLSSLSAFGSDDDGDDMPTPDEFRRDNESAAPTLHPAKRRKIVLPRRSPPHVQSPVIGIPGAPLILDPISDVSSDSTGSVPSSPKLLSNQQPMQDELTMGAEQVRVCQWDGCDAGDLGNQDELVQHVHDEHVATGKSGKYQCEWKDCKAKAKPQMSAYALRAHLRSHTKEKPFYCALPECDRAFTRSDALAKHMRTVHENEGLRTAEHYTKGTAPVVAQNNSTMPTPTPPPPIIPTPQHAAAPTSAKPPGRLKLVFGSTKSSAPSTPNQPSRTNAEVSEIDVNAIPSRPLSPLTLNEVLGPFPDDVLFTDEEKSLPPRELFRLLRRQIHWATQEADALRSELDDGEIQRRKEWMSKELIFENVLEADFAGAEHRGVFGIDTKSASGTSRAEDYGRRVFEIMRHDALIASKLPMQGLQRPWYRDPEAQAYLAARRSGPLAEHNRVELDG